MKNVGIILIILGALVLVASYLLEFSTENAITFGSIGVCILGLILHIILNKKYSE